MILVQYFIISMWDNKSIDDLRKNLNQSIFASTEISSKQSLQRQPQNPEYERNLFQISSKFTDQAKTYLKKIKIKTKQIKNTCFEALKGNITARTSLQKVQHDATICRYQFIKLYHNKKFKLVQGNIISEAKIDNQYIFRQSVDRIRKQKMLDQLAISVRKENQIRNIQEIQQKRKIDKKIFRETMKISDQLIKQRIFQTTSKIKRQEAQFNIRKKNLSELATTRSKFNYMSKINDEMQVIKNYQDQLERINNDDENHQESNSVQNIFTAHFTYHRN